MAKEIINGVVREMSQEDFSEQQSRASVAEQEIQARQQAEATAKAQKEADALAGNNKLLELGLTQAQVTAMTGYTPPAN